MSSPNGSRWGRPIRVSGEKVTKVSSIDWGKGQGALGLPARRESGGAGGEGHRLGPPRSRPLLLSKMEAAGVKPVADADRFALIRRVTLDLTGLPPTVDEVGAFVRDPANDDEALAKVVDRLLASPAFGERWGRHWLDVARYADSVGKTRNIPFSYAWRYRNYVIDAFNADKPYVSFSPSRSRDLIDAGDPPTQTEHLIATGFLALGSMDLNERDREQFLLDRIDDQIDTLGRATMGLTSGARVATITSSTPSPRRLLMPWPGLFASTRTMSGQSNRQGGSKDYHKPNLLVSLLGLGIRRLDGTGGSRGRDRAARGASCRVAQGGEGGQRRSGPAQGTEAGVIRGAE